MLPAVGLMVTAFSSPAQETKPLRYDRTYGRIVAHMLTSDACKFGNRNKANCTLAAKCPEVALRSRQCLIFGTNNSKDGAKREREDDEVVGWDQPVFSCGK